MRATRLVAVGLLAAAAGGCASGSKAVSSTDAARVRVVNDASQVQGCRRAVDRHRVLDPGVRGECRLECRCPSASGEPA